MDMVVRVVSMPLKGETIISKGFKKISGGKGANQAVAARRLGASVYMIGKIGKDENGRALVDNLKRDGINTEYVYFDDVNPTGMAMVTVNDEGNNSIIVVPGSNMALNTRDVEAASYAIKNSKVIAAQFETPMEITLQAFKIAKENEVITLLNPAPAAEIDGDLLKVTDIIVPNESEACTLTGIKIESMEDAKTAAEVLRNRGVKCVIITLGENGAVLLYENIFEIIPAFKVRAVDTTAAGDAFIGALCSKLANSEFDLEMLRNAIKFGNKVSSIVVQKEGAQTSLPYAKDIK